MEKVKLVQICIKSKFWNLLMIGGQCCDRYNVSIDGVYLYPELCIILVHE